MTEAFETSKSPLASSGHGYTYSGHPVGAAAALATLAETKRLNVKDNAAVRGGYVRGNGLTCALELVSDARKKSAPPKKPCRKFKIWTITQVLWCELLDQILFFQRR